MSVGVFSLGTSSLGDLGCWSTTTGVDGSGFSISIGSWSF